MSTAIKLYKLKVINSIVNKYLYGMMKYMTLKLEQ